MTVCKSQGIGGDGQQSKSYNEMEVCVPKSKNCYDLELTAAGRIFRRAGLYLTNDIGVGVIGPLFSWMNTLLHLQFI
jgi:hypothetical protein